MFIDLLECIKDIRIEIKLRFTFAFGHRLDVLKNEKYLDDSYLNVCLRAEREARSEVLS